MQEMYERKVTTLKEVIQNLESQNNKLNQELDRYQASLTVNNGSPSIASLADEVTSLKTKLTDLQRIKSALEVSHKEVITQYQHEMGATIGQLSRRLHHAQLKNDNLELALESVTKRLELLEQHHQQHIASEQLLTQQLKQQLQNQVCVHQKKVAELQHKHIQEISEVRATIDELKAKLAIKEKEVTSIEEVLKEESSNMQEYVKNIKKELQHSSEKNEQKLKAKVWALQRAINKHDRTKAKIIKDYDHKLFQLQKEKNIEVKGLQLQLQTQKAEITACFAQDKQKQFEGLVQNLEERYRLLLDESEKKYLQKQEEDQKRITELENELRVLKKK
ncbi:chromosome partition protein Smc [Anabrus simplex]|uniref:chromosome partition protein Smc n=1 Tax=Anabrus simplex TaxID=316456 RepID=UPI0034DDB1CF